jgi:hypothetical protein
MAQRDDKPHPTFEAVLHQTPVTGMLDSILINELRQQCDSEAGFTRAQRIALRMSWHLHALLGKKVQRI